MLQQTQVRTVIPYYQRFLQAFPDVFALANAESDQVLQLWSGLGYYQRARNLHKCSQIIVSDYGGIFPADPPTLVRLPGIGLSTAHAILSLVHNKPYAIMDGNAKRVLARYFGISAPVDDPKTIKNLWNLAKEEVPQHSCRAYTQGLMDLVLVCVNDEIKCLSCPLQQGCVAFLQQRTDTIPSKRPKAKTNPRGGSTLCVSAWQALANTRPIVEFGHSFGAPYG